MNIELIGENKNIIRCIEDPTCAPDPRGLGVLFYERMKKYSTNVAQIEAETGRTFTYDEVLLGSIRVAQHLQARNVSKEDVIMLCTRNKMELSFPVFAGLFLGVRISAMDVSLPKFDMDYLIKLVTPRFLFCEESFADTLFEITKSAGLNTEIIVFEKTEKYTPFSNFTQSTGDETNFQPRPVQSFYDAAFIFFSSGTTGYPKGICASHYALQTTQEALRQGCDSSVVLSFSSFYWISSTMILTMCVLGGTTRIIAKEFSVDIVLPIISKYKVTYAVFAQYYTYQLCEKYKSTDFDTSSLNTLLFIGEKPNKEYMVKAKQLFPHTAVSSAYGMTEVNGCLCAFDTMRDRHFIETKLVSCGRPIQGFTYKIVNPDTEEALGPNQTGVLRVKGVMMNGYLNNPEATKNAYDREGFLITGDLAYYDEDYCFYIVGREKEMIKFRGLIQSPTVLEDMLLQHPGIKEAVVIGKPDTRDGEHPAAFIVLNDDSELTKEQILEFYNSKIMNYEPKKLKGGIYIMSKIPRTPSGKPKRRELRDCLTNNNV